MNDTEFETKVLNIKIKEIIKKLRELGADETPEIIYRRFVFANPTENVEFIRLRDQDGIVTLTYKFKKVGNTQVGETIEIEVEVSDFDKAAQILKKIPFKRIFYFENKHHNFSFNGIEFSIDTWPKLAPYLEIESNNSEKVEEGLKLLGLTGQEVGDKDIEEIYSEQGINMHQDGGMSFS